VPRLSIAKKSSKTSLFIVCTTLIARNPVKNETNLLKMRRLLNKGDF
jgi:hypothetical protein